MEFESIISCVDIRKENGYISLVINELLRYLKYNNEADKGKGET